MSGKRLWNLVCNLDMSGYTRNFGLWIDFDDLHFTNSPNAPRLIVQTSKHSSYEELE
jgi:hypothetical protein